MTSHHPVVLVVNGVLFLMGWKQREKLENYLKFCAWTLMSHRCLKNSWTPVQIMWLSVLLPMGTALELSQEWMELAGATALASEIWQVVSVFSGP